jgi:hypothetical protein
MFLFCLQGAHMTIFSSNKLTSAFTSALLIAGICSTQVFAQAPAAVSQSAVEVATVTEVKGRVLISSKQGMIVAKRGMKVANGGRLVTSAGASANVMIGSCPVTLGASTQFTYVPKSSCGEYAKLVKTMGQAQSDLAQGDLSPPSAPPPAAPPPVVPPVPAVATGLGGLSTTTLVVGGVAAAGVTAAVVNEVQNRNNASGS